MQKMKGLFRRKSSTKSASSGLAKLRKEPPTPAPPPIPLPLHLPQTPRNASTDPSPYSNGQSTPLSTFSSFVTGTDPQNSRSTVTLPSSVDDQDFAIMGGVDLKRVGGENNGNLDNNNTALGGGGVGKVAAIGTPAAPREEAGSRLGVADVNGDDDEDDDNDTMMATASAIYRTKSAPQQRPKRIDQNSGAGGGSLVPASSHEQQQRIPSRRPSNSSQRTPGRGGVFGQSNTTITLQNGQDLTPRKQQPQHQVNQAQQQQRQQHPQQLVPHHASHNGSASHLPSEWRDREPSVFSRFTHSPTPSESASMQYAHSIASNTTIPRPHTAHAHSSSPQQGYPLNNSSSSLINGANGPNNNNIPPPKFSPNHIHNTTSLPNNPHPNSNNTTTTTTPFINNHHHHHQTTTNRKNNNHHPFPPNNKILPNPSSSSHPNFHPNPTQNSRHHLHPNDHPQRSRYPPGPSGGPRQQQRHPQIPPIPPLPPGVRSGNYRNQHSPQSRQLPALPENSFVNNRSRPPPRQRNPYPPSAMPPSMMMQSNRQQPVPSSGSPPRNKNIQPTPGPESMIIHFNPSQLNCLLGHSDLKKMGNFHHSMPCMTCRKMSVDGMSYCSYCSLRICKTCSSRLHKEWNGDITKGWGAVEVFNGNEGLQSADAGSSRRPATAHGGREYVVRWGTDSRPGTADTTASAASLPMSQTIMKVNNFFNASGTRPSSSHLRPSTANSRPSPLNQLQSNSLAQRAQQQQQQQKPNFGIDISFDNSETSKIIEEVSSPELVHPVPTHYKVNSLLEAGSVSPGSANSSSEQQSPVSPLAPSINLSNGTIDSRVSRSNAAHSRVASNMSVSSVGAANHVLQEKSAGQVDILTEMAMEPKIKRKGLKGMFTRK